MSIDMLESRKNFSCLRIYFLDEREIHVPYFPDYKPRLFFEKFRGSGLYTGLYTGATYERTFPKNHAPHTACYGMPRSALDHDQLTHSRTVIHNH